MLTYTAVFKIASSNSFFEAITLRKCLDGPDQFPLFPLVDPQLKHTNEIVVHFPVFPWRPLIKLFVYHLLGCL